MRSDVGAVCAALSAVLRAAVQGACNETKKDGTGDELGVFLRRIDHTCSPTLTSFSGPNQVKVDGSRSFPLQLVCRFAGGEAASKGLCKREELQYQQISLSASRVFSTSGSTG